MDAIDHFGRAIEWVRIGLARLERGLSARDALAHIERHAEEARRAAADVLITPVMGGEAEG
jgi:hypothetical protein